MKIGIVGKSRYIDVDKLIKDLAQSCVHKAVVTSVINRQPIADVVEVVRCKDCAHKGAAFCMAGDFPLTKENENCYCSYGERIEQ